MGVGIEVGIGANATAGDATIGIVGAVSSTGCLPYIPTPPILPPYLVAIKYLPLIISVMETNSFLGMSMRYQ
jgi:hypothetical protein